MTRLSLSFGYQREFPKDISGPRKNNPKSVGLITVHSQVWKAYEQTFLDLIRELFTIRTWQTRIYPPKSFRKQIQGLFGISFGQTVKGP